MNWKKITLIILVVFGAIVLMFGTFIGYIYYERLGKFTVNTEKYPRDIGYIDHENTEFSEEFQLCNPSDYPNGYYHSARDIFNGGKYQFRKTISEKYTNNGYTDSGFLNLRFLLNCKGEIGNVEINELNTDYEKTDLNDELVSQLVTLSIAKQNWIPKEIEGKTYDSYMYLIFKIEDGEVLEILP
jgi:hypothetical protein